MGGQQLQGLNGGSDFTFNEAVSFVIECDDQLWDALTAGGGEPGPCGWLKDRFGLSWQIVLPRRLNELLDEGRARRAMDAMLQMHKIEVAELERQPTPPRTVGPPGRTAGDRECDGDRHEHHPRSS